MQRRDAAFVAKEPPFPQDGSVGWGLPHHPNGLAHRKNGRASPTLRRRTGVDRFATGSRPAMGDVEDVREELSVTARILDGKRLAEELRSETAEQVKRFADSTGVCPHLTAVLVGADPASEVYVRNKRRACERAGLTSSLESLPASATFQELLDVVHRLNRDPRVHGILVQLPLPKDMDPIPILRAVDPKKDVDAFHPYNVGLISEGRPRFLPCTPAGIQQLLVRSGIEIAGSNVVIVGRSNLVGKPLAMMLLQKANGADATVTVCHSRTRELPEHVRRADVVVAAIGRPKMITADMVKPGATVIDVGINRTDQGKLVGDVDYDAVREVAGAITPVPGGVGPMTIAMLLANTLKAARLSLGSNLGDG